MTSTELEEFYRVEQKIERTSNR